MGDVEVSVVDGTGRILLNRPKAINALTSDMIATMSRVLEEWAEDPTIDEVVISGAGRGFCAGADVREMRQMIIEETGDPVEMLAREYCLDAMIASYPKPYRAQIHGIVMGGGMGVSIHGSHRSITADTVLAMPETIIGLWPDVGMCYHLARIPGELGMYMALTGLTITGDLATGVGLTDELTEGTHQSTAPPAWMESAFAGDDIFAILERLETSELPHARTTAETIRSRSPLSVAVSLEAIRRAATMTQEEVFAQDLQLGRFFCSWPDFVEGVRAQLVDKDFTPTWVHSSLEEVTAVEVRTAFGDS
ncbi:MAG: enoyl-CoA hydratase/isomerase family protein [Propionibacteriaceae bacterium]|jgi:enoyl-CoA hydratase|nr:enoyl-CoA hydratase/isomerase family protein [Propionibacteriaceae bacterium]